MEFAAHRIWHETASVLNLKVKETTERPGEADTDRLWESEVTGNGFASKAGVSVQPIVRNEEDNLRSYP